MFTKNTKILFLVLFLVGAISVLIFRIWQVKRAKNIPFSPQESSFILQPPSDALQGKLVSAKGKVEKEPREKDEFEEVELEEEILQGEKLLTGERSQATVEFQDFAKIDSSSDTEIGFINLIPSKFLISQSSGSVVYKLLDNDNSLSVRALHALVNFSGETEVVTKGEEIKVKILSGQAKLALVDLENKTHVWKLEEGQKALIDDTERTVEIKKL